MNHRLRQSLVTWIVVYPIITGLTIGLEPMMREWPTPQRTLLLSALMVPIMVGWAVPFAHRRFHRFLNPTESESPESNPLEPRGTPK